MNEQETEVNRLENAGYSIIVWEYDMVGMQDADGNPVKVLKDGTVKYPEKVATEKELSIERMEKVAEEILDNLEDNRRAYSQYGEIECMRERIDYLERMVTHLTAFIAEHLRLSAEETHGTHGLLDW